MTRTDDATLRRQDDRSTDEYLGLNRSANIGFTLESLRAAQASTEPAKPEEKISVYWRVFGGTILSITALVCIQAYQSLSSAIHEVRADQNRMRDTASDYVKKDDLTTRTTTLWNRVQELQNLSAAVTVASTKLATIDTQLAAADRERRDLQANVAQIPTLRDRFAPLEEQKKVTEQDHKDVVALQAALQALRDKDVLLEKKLAESELERKEQLRELQSLRERLAKLEGQQLPPAPSGKTTLWKADYRD